MNPVRLPGPLGEEGRALTGFLEVRGAEGLNWRGSRCRSVPELC